VLPPRAILRDVELTGNQFGVHLDELEVELTRIRAARRIIELRTVAAQGIRVRFEGLPRTAPRRRSSLSGSWSATSTSGTSGLRRQRRSPGHVDLAVEGARPLVWTTEQATPAGSWRPAGPACRRPALEPLDFSLPVAGGRRR